MSQNKFEIRKGPVVHLDGRTSLGLIVSKPKGCQGSERVQQSLGGVRSPDWLMCNNLGGEYPCLIDDEQCPAVNPDGMVGAIAARAKARQESMRPTGGIRG